MTPPDPQPATSPTPKRCGRCHRFTCVCADHTTPPETYRATVRPGESFTFTRGETTGGPYAHLSGSELNDGIGATVAPPAPAADPADGRCRACQADPGRMPACRPCEGTGKQSVADGPVAVTKRAGEELGDWGEPVRLDAEQSAEFRRLLGPAGEDGELQRQRYEAEERLRKAMVIPGTDGFLCRVPPTVLLEAADRDLIADELTRLRDRLAAAEARVRTLCRDSAADHTHLAGLCRSAGVPADRIEGSPDAVPGLVDLADMLAERARAAEKMVAGLKDELARVDKDRQRWCQVADMHAQKARGEYWAWQGDSEDHPESLVCPVLIGPNDLRALLARADGSFAAGWAACQEAAAKVCDEYGDERYTCSRFGQGRVAAVRTLVARIRSLAPPGADAGATGGQP